MSTKKAHASTTREQFDQESSALATEFYAVLQGRTLSAGVVLEALMLLHRLETKRLPPEIRAINAYKIKPRPLWTRLFFILMIAEDCFPPVRPKRHVTLHAEHACRLANGQ